MASDALIVASLFYATNFRYFSTLNDKQLTNYVNSLASDEWKAKYFYSDATKQALLSGYSDFTKTYNSCNDILLFSGLIGLVVFAVLCIFGNKYRKKYYLSNLIVGVALNALMVILTVVTIVYNIRVFALFADNKHTLGLIKDNFDILKEYTLSLSYCYAAFVFQILALVAYGLNIAYTVVKFITSKVDDLSSEKINDVEEVTE